MFTKQCFKCLEVKPLDDFYKHAMMADGHLNKCKVCARKDVREHRKVSERPREYDRERYYNDPNRMVSNYMNMRQWRKENPEGYKAHMAVNNAIRSGKLIRQPCRICGAKGHAHHEDYSKPFEIDWLCALHHQQLHAPEKMLDETK